MTAKTGALDPRRIGTLTWDTPDVQPTQDNVLIRLDPPKQTASGIIIPESAQEDAMVEAVVVAVGPGTYQWSKKLKRDMFKPTMLRAGQRVLVKRDPGWILGECRMLREGAIEAVLEDEDTVAHDLEVGYENGITTVNGQASFFVPSPEFSEYMGLPRDERWKEPAE